MRHEIKIIEIRDRMTKIVAVAFRLRPAGEDERALLAHAGFGRQSEQQAEYVHLYKPHGERCRYSPFSWDDRTMATAHRWISEHWDEVESGGVVDVRLILGEPVEP